MSIKVCGVRGENLTPGSDAQDFVLNSHPVMVASGTQVLPGAAARVEARRPEAGAVLPTASDGRPASLRSRQNPS